MRGLIPAHIMAAIESRTGLAMSDMIDIFAGPSTGSILNAAMNVPDEDDPKRPKYRAKHLVRFYEREGAKIFPHDRFREFRGFIHDFNNRTMRIGQLKSLFRHGHYDPRFLHHALSALYGKTQLNESLKTLIVPFYNIEGQQIEPLAEPGETDDLPVHTVNNISDNGGHAVWLKSTRAKTPMVDAIMASCAAPTYYPCHGFTVKYPAKQQSATYSGIDGSIFDNPCISYLGAVRRLVPSGNKLIMIVLGTGHTNRPIAGDEWNKYGALGVVDPVNDLPLINIFFHASESALMESFAEDLGNNLFVFNKPMYNTGSADDRLKFPSAQIDDASPGNLKNLRAFSMAILQENEAQFNALCDVLVENYREKQALQQARKPGWLERIKAKLSR